MGLGGEGRVCGWQGMVIRRDEADPAGLLEGLRGGLGEGVAAVPGLGAAVEHAEHFRPGKPVPTHRDGAEG